MTKPYPTGASHRIDDEWRSRVDAGLKAKGWDRKVLAAKVGCDPSAITVIMRPAKDPRSVVQSRLKPAIDKALGLEDPALDELDAELIRAIRGLDDDMKRHLLGIAEKLAGGSRGHT